MSGILHDHRANVRAAWNRAWAAHHICLELGYDNAEIPSAAHAVWKKNIAERVGLIGALTVADHYERRSGYDD